MARAKRTVPARDVAVRVDEEDSDRLRRIALLASSEEGRPVLPSEVHRRLFRPMLVIGESCAACRAGTCDGSAHVRQGNYSKISNCSQDEPEPGAAVVKNTEQTSAPKYVETNEKTSAAAQVESFFLKPEPAPEPKAKRAPIKRAYPEGFVLTDEMRAYAVKNGIASDRVDGMFEHFSNHHRSKGSRFVDWTLAFYTWVRNDRQYGGKNQTSAGQPSAIQGGKDDLPW